MTFWVFSILGGLGVAAIGAFIWFLGFNKSRERVWVAEQSAAKQKEIADAKTTEAAIHAKPAPDTWRGSIGEL